jgi:nucleoside-diphosphate-sugar epimerase
MLQEDKMESQRFIVTGGTSFIGRHLVERLLEEGKPLILFVRDPSKVPQDWKGNVEVVNGDIREKRSLAKLPFEGSIVFHLAGEIERKALYFDINVRGTGNLVDLAARAGTKHFIHLSSVGVFGHPTQNLIDENVSCHPINEYEKSKYEGEKILAEYHERYSVPITILRPSIVFGEGSNSGSFLGWMRSIKNRTFRFTGDKAYANYVYVGDVVEALVLVSERARFGKEVFIVSDTKTMREFVQCVATILGVNIPEYSIPRWLAFLVAGAFTPMTIVLRKRFPLTISRVKALTDRRIFSSEKIEKQLGFQPKFGFVKGLQRTLMWYEKEGLL